MISMIVAATTATATGGGGGWWTGGNGTGLEVRGSCPSLGLSRSSCKVWACICWAQSLCCPFVPTLPNPSEVLKWRSPGTRLAPKPLESPGAFPSDLLISWFSWLLQSGVMVEPMISVRPSGRMDPMGRGPSPWTSPGDPRGSGTLTLCRQGRLSSPRAPWQILTRVLS